MAPQGEVDVQTIVPAWEERISPLHTHCHVLVADTQYKHLQRRFLASLSEEDRTQNPIYASGCSCEQSDKWLGESCRAFAEAFQMSTSGLAIAGFISFHSKD